MTSRLFQRDLLPVPIPTKRTIPAFSSAKLVNCSIIRVKEGVTHFFPGSYQYLLSTDTDILNLYMSGDLIVTSHGSHSQEKAYVTGLEAANLVVDKFKKRTTYSSS